MVDSILVDATDPNDTLKQLESDLSEAVTAREQQQTDKSKKQTKAEEEVKELTDDLPAKLKGKSLREIAEIYQNLESAYGRMANDLGTQRKLTDRLLDLKRETDLGSNGATQKAQIKSEDLLTDPTAALEKVLAPREEQTQQRMAAMEAELHQQRFVARHPDYTDYVNSPQFAEWVNASPIRQRAAAAAANGDWDIAGDLLAEYKVNKPKATQADDEQKEVENNLKAARKVALESGSQSQSGAQKPGKVYRRSALIELRMTNPDKYYDEGFQAEISRAYAEGRVK